MSNKITSEADNTFSRRAIDSAIKIAAIGMIIMWCFDIIKPFIVLIVWGAILAIALYPLTKKLSSLVGGRIGLASAIIALIGISILVIPAIKFSASSIETVQTLSTHIQEETLSIPPPTEQVKEWPLIGEKSHALWSEASSDISDFLSKYSSEIKEYSSKVLATIASAGGTLVQFIVSLIIAAVFMTNAESCQKACQRFMTRLMNEKGEITVANSVLTIRSVAQGVLGIAAIQTILSTIGMVITDIPAVGIWALAVLMVAIIQLPPIIILGPISAYYFSIAETTPAVIFLIWNIVVSSSDAFLKPLLLGRGTDTPMLVILLGAIGGMIMSGIIGLFTGAVVLALGFQLLTDWLNQTDDKTDNALDTEPKNS